MPKKKDEISDEIARYEWVRKITDDAIRERSSVSEFHGLEQELREMQIAILESYRRTKPIKHPRDKGDHREEILRHFLSTHGLIPKKYDVSTGSTRVVAPSGHISPELDIVFFDYAETIVLKRFSGTLDYLPVESVHGTIQVKSRLSKQALRDGLDNIRAFKTLEPDNLEKQMGGFTIRSGLPRRFGILFAYEYDLEWDSVCEELRIYAAEYGARLLPNAIFILDKGRFGIGSQEKYSIFQNDLEEIVEPIVYGFPDNTGSCLLEFYSILMGLLGKSTAGAPNVDTYLRMPLTAGSLSYSYSRGALSEIEDCPTHGAFLKVISESNLAKIIDYVRSCEPINWIRALDIAQGKAGDEEDRYARQPDMVRIYNPENHDLSQILINQKGFLIFESIDVEGMTVYLPLYYVAKEGLIDDCPKCQKDAARRLTRPVKRTPKPKSEDKQS